jgi:peptidoglycan/LPS O-acetylase OafA/YrhL
MGIHLLAALFLFCFCFSAFGGHPGLSRFLARRPIRLFGGLSYSFYLTHGLALNFLNHVAAPRLFGGVVPSPLAWLWYPASIIAATVVAAGFFLLFERHFIRRHVNTQVASRQEDFRAGMTCAAGNQRAACRAAAAATRC